MYVLSDLIMIIGVGAPFEKPAKQNKTSILAARAGGLRICGVGAPFEKPAKHKQANILAARTGRFRIWRCAALKHARSL